MFGTKNKTENANLANMANLSVILIVVFYILYIGASLIIPFVIAVIISLAIIGLYNFFKNKKIPSFLAIILSILFYLLIFWFLGFLIQSNLTKLIQELPNYQESFSKTFISLSQKYSFLGVLDFEKFFSSFNLQKIFTGLIGSITSILSNAGLIIFYILFILLEYRFFQEKIHLIISKYSNEKEIAHTIKKIQTDVKTYFVVKTFMSFLSATLSYIIMLSFGLQFAEFWAVGIFLLNYIPNVGSIIAITFPSLLSLVQPDFTIYSSVFMITLLIGLDNFLGNFVEPKLTGNKLNLSPLVILFALVFWGAIWGIVGMFLSVPIMVIINIICSKFPSTESIAILLSEKGNIEGLKE